MSAAPKSRLGRGLGGLIAAAKPATPVTVAPASVEAAAPTAAFASPAASPAATTAATPATTKVGAPGYLEIAVHLIEPSPYQARREISPAQLRELAIEL